MPSAIVEAGDSRTRVLVSRARCIDGSASAWTPITRTSGRTALIAARAALWAAMRLFVNASISDTLIELPATNCVLPTARAAASFILLTTALICASTSFESPLRMTWARLGSFNVTT
jgi:hypothetical protein